MKRTLIRLGIAAAISTACYGLTLWWYVSGNKIISQSGNQKPIAYVNRTKDEINRRPVTRLLWSLVNEGDPLYPGEALRTSSLGEARINFAESDRFIDIEPDSLIVINKSENEISLDLMDGSVMVNQGTAGSGTLAAGPALTLKSGQNKVDLSQANASLSKSSEGIDLQVLKGKAKIENAKGESKEIETGKRGALGAQGAGGFKPESLQILLPLMDKPVLVSLDSPAPVKFSWKGFPEGALVSLETGVTRKDLKSRGETVADSFELAMKPGRYFWKLVAKDKTTNNKVAESGIFKVEVAARQAPTPLTPQLKTVLPKTQAELKVDFRWSKPEQIQAVTLEVWKDASLKDRVFVKSYTTESSASVPLPDGDYFWRVSGSFEGLEKPITSKMQNFTVIAEEKLRPPVQIGWILRDEKTPQYFVDQPMANLAWSTEQKDQVKMWRLKISENEDELSLDQAQVIETTSSDAKTKLSKPGRYIAMVEALDVNKKVISQSETKSFEVAPLPLLPVTRFDPADGDLKSDQQGRLNLQWTNVPGAKEYQLTLFDKAGKEIRNAKFSKNSTALVNLLPGSYRVSVVAIDQHGRKGTADPVRNVLVPETSGLNAPKLKTIKVK